MNGLELARERLTDDGEPPLPFERWRELAPRMTGREPDEREELLTAANIDGPRWDRADGYWSLMLAAECARGDRARAEDFGRACAEDLHARQQAPSPATKDPLPEEVVPPGVLPSVPMADPEPPARVAPVPEVVVPTFLRPGVPEPLLNPPLLKPPLLVPPPAPRGERTVEMSPFAALAVRAALPFGAVSRGAPGAAPPRPSGLPPQSGATLDLSSLPVSPRLLAPGSAPGWVPAPSQRAACPGRAPPPHDSGATIALDPDLVARVLAGNPPTKI